MKRKSPGISTQQAWLSAVRLRTLPLALASIGMGSFLAADQYLFDFWIFLLCVLTTIFLQILSNLANDYGDTVHGADSNFREGPARSVQSGLISAKRMKTAMVFMAVLSFGTGLLLIYVALGFNWTTFLFFMALGVVCIAGAIAYTAGKRPYGYAGFGDVAVLFFFGIVGVTGTYYMFGNSFEVLYLLPALSCGFFATAVLNVNNIRDINADKLAGKKSIPVRIGRRKARIYHWLLLFFGFLSAVCFTVLYFQSWWQFLFFLSLPLLIENGVALQQKENANELDPYLKKMALTTLLFVLSFGAGLLLG